MLKRVSVIIVTYNSEYFINKCVDSVLKNLGENGEIIVIDNKSTDKTLEKIKKYEENKTLSDKIKILEAEENLGFGKANNKAAKLAEGEYLFFLNPDTFLEKDVIAGMIGFYEKNEKIGLVSPKLVLRNGDIQSSVKKLPTLVGAIKEYIFGIRNSYQEYSPENDIPVEVEAVYGAAMLIKKKIFDDIGGFDEKYFLYYEDIDLCRRLKKKGKKIFYYPSVSIEHLVGGSKVEFDRGLLNNQSARIYHGFLGYFLLQLIFLVPRLRRRLGVR